MEQSKTLVLRQTAGGWWIIVYITENVPYCDVISEWPGMTLTQEITKNISWVLIFVIVVGFNAFLALSHIIAVVSNRYHGSFQWVPKHGPDLTFVTLFDLEDIDQGQWNLSRVKIMWTPINPQRDVVLAFLDSEISAGHFRTAPSNGRLRQVPHHYMC